MGERRHCRRLSDGEGRAMEANGEGGTVKEEKEKRRKWCFEDHVF